jgi:UDP-N-acetylglucosamine 3-dehydrogenase
MNEPTNTTQPEHLRAGLIGLGAMGRSHARVLQSLPGVELVAAVDPRHPPQTPPLRVPVLDTVRELVDHGIDMCVVATPTTLHESIALELAEAGVAALIEKPLAHDSKAAQTICEAFARNGVIGCVGHIERYNPALQDMRRRLALGELGTVYQVATRRQGPFPARIADSGVVLDLATHDIDLTAWVTGAAYRAVSARVACKSGRAHEDLVSAVGELAGGIVVTHVVNWLSPLKERIITVTGELGCFVADTITADLTFYQNGTLVAQWERVAEFRGVTEGHMIRYAIPKPEPLVTELSQFAAAVRGDPASLVSLEEGLTTVRVAEALRESATTGKTVDAAA